MRSLAVLAVVASFALAVACGGEAEPEETPDKAAPADKDEGEEEAPAEPEEEKLPEPEVPKSEITGDLLEPKIWKTPAEVNQTCGEHLDQARKLRDEVVAVEGDRTAGNTLDVVNRIFVQIDRVLPVSELMANVHPDKKVRTASEKCQQDAMKLVNELQLDRGVYDALASLDADALDGLGKRSLEHLLRDYRRAGVDKDEATRKKLAKLHEEMVKTGQEFSRRIREDKRFIEIAPEDLAGMPEDYVKAHPPGKNGKVKITTDYPDFFPLQNYADKEQVRAAAYKKFLERAYPDNVKTLEKLLALRHEYATILGYAHWADYNAEDKMAKDAKTIGDFIDRIADIARPRMERDLEDILARKQKDQPDADTVRVWDRFYYVKKIQAERFGVDSQEVRQYFDYPKVKQGLLEINEKLWGVEFARVEGAPVWHEDVEAYDVMQGPKRLGRIYMDMHPREGKYGHAAMFQVFTGFTATQLPAASMVCNFPQPSDEGPALMEHGDVTTFFHEFGHLMHHLLASGYRYANLSGLNCEWDFVEVPSQLMEEWAWDPVVLRMFAKHHETGEPIPIRLVEKMRAADEFGKGVHVMRQMFYAGLSFAYHNRDPEDLDLLAMLKKTQERYNPYPYEDGTWVYANFGHLEGYSSMYYTYMWSLVLAKDAFTMFQKHGLMDEEIAARYRKYVLEAGGAVDAKLMVENFLGRESTFDAFRKYLEKG
jgi:thimet oligopeptidase